MSNDINPQQSLDQTAASEFEKQAMESSPSLAAEFREFLVHNKAWWLVPIIVALVAMGAMVLLSESVVAPFIYPLF